MRETRIRHPLARAHNDPVAGQAVARSDWGRGSRRAASAALAMATAAAWRSRDVHVGASLGLSIAVVAVLLPVWAGWSWLPAAARAAVLAAAPLAIGGVAHVALRWTADSRAAIESL